MERPTQFGGRVGGWVREWCYFSESTDSQESPNQLVHVAPLQIRLTTARNDPTDAAGDILQADASWCISFHLPRYGASFKHHQI